MSNKTPKWSQSLSAVAWVNSVAISADGARVVGGTFRHDYTNRKAVEGTYGTFAFDSAGNPLWADTFDGPDGIFAVNISGDGTVAAGGGVFTATEGLLRVFNAQTGSVLFDSTAAGANEVKGRVSVIGLSDSGSVAAAAAGQLYVLVKSGLTYVPAVSATPAGDPNFHTALKTVSAVAVHPSGRWLAACNQKGQVLVATLTGATIARAALSGTIEEPVNPASSISPKAPVPFLSIAIAAHDDSFVVAGGDVVYAGSLSDVLSGKAMSRYDASSATAPIGGAGHPKPNVRWTTISGDGLTFASVANRNVGGEILIYRKGTFTPVAEGALRRGANGVSMDQSGQILAACDGYPVDTAASVYRFDRSGNQIWRHATPNMNWPVAVSADGSSLASGGDDGVLSYFLP